MSFTINLTKENRERNIKLFLKAKSLSNKIKLDELDCNTSWARKPTSFSFDNIFQRCLFEDEFRLILKYQIDNQFCFSISTDRGKDTPVYFIWIYLDYEAGRNLLDKYGIIIPVV